MGRATSGVTGMKFRGGDELLSMSVIPAGLEDQPEPRYVFTVTDGGWAKRTEVSEYRLQGRGGLGIKAMKLRDARGSLVGAVIVTDTDEVMCIKASGQVTRTGASDVPLKGRDTMGVRFVEVRDGDQVVAIARNAEREDLVEGDAVADNGVADTVSGSDQLAELQAQTEEDVDTDGPVQSTGEES
jgi:DNA gyrase subunit A